MKKTLIALALAASLPACTPPQSAGAMAVNAVMTLDQAEHRYLQAKAFIDFARVILPAATVARIDVVLAKIDAAFVRARAAATLLEQLSVLKEIDASIVALEAAAAG